MSEIGGEVVIGQDATSHKWAACDDEGRLLAMGDDETEVLARLADLAA